MQGEIATLEHTVTFSLGPRPGSSSPQAPAFDIVAVNRDGIEVRIGAAWSKTITRGERKGEEYLTLTFDDPSFAKPLNAAAFKDARTGDYEIVFRHRQAKAA